MEQHPSLEVEPQSSGGNFQRIFVAIDNQDEAEKVFDTALQLAQIDRAGLMLFHTILEDVPGVPEISTFASMGGYSWVYTQEMMEVREQLLQ